MVTCVGLLVPGHDPGALNIVGLLERLVVKVRHLRRLWRRVGGRVRDLGLLPRRVNVVELPVLELGRQLNVGRGLGRDLEAARDAPRRDTSGCRGRPSPGRRRRTHLAGCS